MNRSESEPAEQVIVDRYRALMSQDGEPCAESDRTILAHAQQATAAQEVHHSPRWAMPLSMLAALVVGFGLFAKMNDLIELPPPSARSNSASKPALMPVELVELTERQKAQFRDMMAKVDDASNSSRPPTGRPVKPGSAPAATVDPVDDLLAPAISATSSDFSSGTNEALTSADNGDIWPESRFEVASNELARVSAASSSDVAYDFGDDVAGGVTSGAIAEASQEPPADAIVITGVGLRQDDRVSSQKHHYLKLLRQLMVAGDVERFGSELSDFAETFPDTVLPNDIVCFGINHDQIDRSVGPDC